MAYQQPTAPTPSIQHAAVVAAGPPNTSHLDRPVASSFAGTDLRSMKTACEFSLREYTTLLKRRHEGASGSNERIHAHRGIVVSDLRALRSEVSTMMKTAEARRWQKWLLGGIVAAIIPAVRKVFRRSADDEAANDTEYAFRKSKSLIARILDSTHGKSGLASVAFFVLAVLYVFQSEVSLRVARTVSKRLKKLAAKVERGDEGVGEEDMKTLSGWRWRVLLW